MNIKMILYYVLVCGSCICIPQCIYGVLYVIVMYVVQKIKYLND